ncbi:GmrSD restriction endonuclease domain-containing protein [Kocuria rhizosphaericola]|uniref:GmrSD restriction endonuclease domain-containing protein n=1 Tax=Kocuria rhizosphaericola TaxID=3376284 RepID=UPI0037B555C5
MRRTAAPQARARRAALVPLVVALGVLAGCTPPAPEGSSPAARALAALPFEDAGAGEDYDRRAQFGEWADPDGNGCDARNDILARDLTGDVVDDDGCTVLSGTLEDPYTGRTIAFERGPLTSSDVQIDHVVALKNAWISGADRLGPDERTALANDPLNLRAVDGPTNGEKSASDAAEWLPPDESFRCEYVATQIAVKARYELFVTAPERDAMAEVLAGCPDQFLPRDVPPAGDAAAAGPFPMGPSATETSATDEVYYADCAAVRAAGAAPLRSDQPGYRPALDRGGTEGLACE